MAGLYIHIPFCRKACYYCDFHFSVSLKNKDGLIDALLKEIEQKQDYLQTNELETIYIGGGTPSVVPVNQLKQLFEVIQKFYKIQPGAEITMEVNPDDCSENYLNELSQLPVNRISLGIQSFIDAELQLMNRRHSALRAIQSVDRIKKCGFGNINVDILYGVPGSDINSCNYNIDKTLMLDVDHISLYHLSYEPKTIFSNWVKKNKIVPINEDISLEQFEMLIEKLGKNDYQHYEISNFARNNRYSNHNTGYWLGKQYIGIGPSAHSYNGKSRSWNVGVNTEYIASINNGLPYFQTEIIDVKTRYNEYIMTSLRTMWGINLQKIEDEFGEAFLENTHRNLKKFKKSGDIEIQQTIAKLTKKGIFISDYIISEFFIT